MSSVFKAIGKFVSKIFTPKMPDIPKISMPDAGAAASKLAVRKKMQGRAKSGREGTIYSGGAYGGLNLGGTS